MGSNPIPTAFAADDRASRRMSFSMCASDNTPSASSTNALPSEPNHSDARRRRRKALLWICLGIGLAIGGSLAVVMRSQWRSPEDEALAQLGELTPDARTILSLHDQRLLMQVAAKLYRNECTRCHGMDGQGMSGPNLTDEYYVNVQRAEDIYDIIANGRNHNAMPAWKYKLSKNEMIVLSSYVAALRGRDLKGRPRDARAVEIAPWPVFEVEEKEVEEEDDEESR